MNIPPHLEQIKPALHIARGLAMLALAFSDYRFLMGAAAGDPAMAWLLGLSEGRPEATFAVLAGMTISQVTNKERFLADLRPMRKKQRALMFIGLLLFVLGMLCALVYGENMLHFLGLYIIIGQVLLPVGKRSLLAIASGISLLFAVLVLGGVPYQTGWAADNPLSRQYLDFWSFTGMLRHLLFNGYYAVLPWLALFIVGMWLGRMNLKKRAIRNGILASALLVSIAAELAVDFMQRYFEGAASPVEGIPMQRLLDSYTLPPMPFFIFSAGGVAVAAILMAIILARRYRSLRLLATFEQLGRMSLSLYVFHLIVVVTLVRQMGAGTAVGVREIYFVFAGFTVFALVASFFYRRIARYGPLEQGIIQILRRAERKLPPSSETPSSSSPL